MAGLPGWPGDVRSDVRRVQYAKPALHKTADQPVAVDFAPFPGAGVAEGESAATCGIPVQFGITTCEQRSTLGWSALLNRIRFERNDESVFPGFAQLPAAAQAPGHGAPLSDIETRGESCPRTGSHQHLKDKFFPSPQNSVR